MEVDDRVAEVGVSETRMELEHDHLRDAMTVRPRYRLFSYSFRGYTEPLMHNTLAIPPLTLYMQQLLPSLDPQNGGNLRHMSTETVHDATRTGEVPMDVMSRMDLIVDHLGGLIASCIPETYRFQDAHVQTMASITCCGYVGPIFAFALMELTNLKPLNIPDLTERASRFYGKVSVYQPSSGIQLYTDAFVDLSQFLKEDHAVYYFIFLHRANNGIYHHFATICLGEFILIIDGWQSGLQGNRLPWVRLMRLEDFRYLMHMIDTTTNPLHNKALLDVYFQSPHYDNVAYTADPLYHVRFIRMDRGNPAITGLFYGVGGKKRKHTKRTKHTKHTKHTKRTKRIKRTKRTKQ